MAKPTLESLEKRIAELEKKLANHDHDREKGVTFHDLPPSEEAPPQEGEQNAQ